MSEWKKYLELFRKELDVWAIWEPGQKVSLFNYGKVDNGKWNKLGSLWELVEKTKNDTSEVTKETDIQLGSASISNIQQDAEVGNKVASASITINFSNEAHLLVKLFGSKKETIVSLQNLADRLIAVYGEKWNRDWYLVSGLRTAKNFSVLGASKPNSEIRLNASLPVINDFLSGNMKNNTSVQTSGSVMFSYLGCSGPVYMDLVRIRKRMLGGYEVKQFSSENNEGHLIFESIKPSDLEF